jgi:polyisoprenyl-teichoic acid--peptidoglycan teichoic acid transferase
MPVVVAAALAACTSNPAPGQPSSGSSGSSQPAPASGAPAGSVTVSGAPAGLAALVSSLYAGSDLGGSASRSAAAALKARTAGRATKAATAAQASVGTWMGTPVAVVTAGADVTLAVGPSWKVVGGWWPSLGVPGPSLGAGGPRWVLAIGSDARKGQPLERTRADVLQVIGVDGHGGGGVMGMARDLWVPLSTGGKGKINAAMVFGGPRAQVSTVEAVTGLPLEGYVVLGFSGFRKIVDDEGGLPIVIPRTVVASHAKDLVIKAGPQTLSGAEALAYARERKTLPDGDFGRSRHQGEVILAAAVKAKLAGPAAIPSALTSFSAVGRSDLSAEQILTFAAGLHTLSPLQVGRGVAKGAFGTTSGQSIVVLGAEARRLFASFRDGNLP